MSFIITKEALKILAMNNASCKVFGDKRVKNLKYLTVCAMRDMDFDYDDLVANLPESGIMYGSIKSFAKYLGKNLIDLETILKFLGGQWHIDYVLEQTSLSGMKSLGDGFREKFLFSHILLVAEITEIGSEICAKYSIDNAEVVISGLVQHLFVSSDLRIGQKVLLHQALILEVNPDVEVEKLLIAQQMASHEFVSVVRKLKVIDYNEFWEMKQWTKEIIAGL